MSPTSVVRGVFAGGTAAFALLGLFFRDDPRWFAASGLCGLLWGGWGFLSDHVLGPIGGWVGGLFARAPGGGLTDASSELDQTILRLEARLAAGEGRSADLRTAAILIDLHRRVKDPASAARVLALVRERYPDAPEPRPGGPADR